jgi:RNA polymerase sigma factor (sigma-70 family)
MAKYQPIRPLAKDHDHGESTEHSLIHNVQELLTNRMQQLKVDPEAVRDWERFHQLYDRIIRRMAAACRLGATDTDDLVQEVWMHVIRRLPDLRPSGDRYSFRGGLYTIVRHEAVDFIRRRQGHPVVPMSDALQSRFEPESTDPSPEARFDRCSTIAFVESLVECAHREDSHTERAPGLCFKHGIKFRREAASSGEQGSHRKSVECHERPEDFHVRRVHCDEQRRVESRRSAAVHLRLGARRYRQFPGRPSVRHALDSLQTERLGRTQRRLVSDW